MTAEHPSSWTRRVVDRTLVGDPAELPRIVLALGPCRSGSTSLVMAAAAAGVASYMQPLKVVLRCLISGVESSWRVPTRPPRSIFVKETLGPCLRAEVEFDPLAALIEAGVPPEAIHLVVVGREPLSAWSSWAQWWGEGTSLDLFAAAWRATERARKSAEELNIAVDTFVYEAIRDADPALAAAQMPEGG